MKHRGRSKLATRDQGKDVRDFASQTLSQTVIVQKVTKRDERSRCVIDYKRY
jgi:hypothetical protein